MPRRPNPDLEERILIAARRLWQKGGEKALTMRAVAKTAATNTPAVYRRFQNRHDILCALLRRAQRDVVAAVEPCSSPEEACERYVEFAMNHPHEYSLFYEQAYQLPIPVRQGHTPPLREHRPTMALMEGKLADRLGGTGSDYTRLSLALWTMSHGTAMLLISKAIPDEHVAELRSAFTAAVATLISNAPRMSA